MAPKTKLELTWIGKENRPKLEPRILLEDSKKTYQATHRMTNHDLFVTGSFSAITCFQIIHIQKQA